MLLPPELKVQGVPFSSEFLKCVIDKPTWEQILIRRSPFTTFQINDAKVICQNEEELILRIRPGDVSILLVILPNLTKLPLEIGSSGRIQHSGGLGGVQYHGSKDTWWTTDPRGFCSVVPLPPNY
jgi:hypothetical protein